MRGISGPKDFYLTHLSMHYDSPVTNHELESYLAPFGDPSVSRAMGSP